MGSPLNPDSSEFNSQMSSLSQAGYLDIFKAIKVSSYLPFGAAYDSFKTFTDFNVVSSQLKDNIIKGTNKIIAKEFSKNKLKGDEHESNVDKIMDFNDYILDKVNINIDTVCGLNKPNQQFLKNDSIHTNASPWSNTPNISKIKMGSTIFIGSKNIPRPQLNFKDKIDNSVNLWTPKIIDKPNNIKPLCLEMMYNDEDEPIGYAHPYQTELDAYHPPAEFVMADTDPPQLPPPVEQTALTVVTTEKQLDSLIEHLCTVKEFAVDVEHHSLRTYLGITCLIQISTNEGGDFILDGLSLREHLHKLNLVFTNPKILKVLHGAIMDVQWLQRDFGVYIVGMFDTYEAAKLLKMPILSLQYLVSVFCNIVMDKTHRLADWRLRPLPEELIHYARLDTHYLLYIWHCMKANLLQSAAEAALLLSAFEQSRHICGITYKKPVVDENSHIDLYVKSRKNFNVQQMTCLQMLYMWRDQQARELDEGVLHLISNKVLLTIAENLPRELQGLYACCGQMSSFVKQHLLTIHKMVLACRALEIVPQTFPMPASVNAMINSYCPSPAYKIHDNSYIPHVSEDNPNNFHRLNIVENKKQSLPDLTLLYANDHCNVVAISRQANKSPLSPHLRYTIYRTLAQTKEMNDFKYRIAKTDTTKQTDAGQISRKRKISNDTDVKQSTDNSDNQHKDVSNIRTSSDGLNAEKQSKEDKSPVAKTTVKMSNDKIVKRNTDNSEAQHEDVSNTRTHSDGLKAEKQCKKDKSTVAKTTVKSHCYTNVNYKRFHTPQTSKKSKGGKVNQ